MPGTRAVSLVDEWRQTVATRLLVFQLVIATPLVLWTIPQAIAARAWGIIALSVGQMTMQAGLAAWRKGPLFLRGGMASLGYTASGVVILLGGDTPAAVLFLMTGLMLCTVMLGQGPAIVLLVLVAGLLAARAGGMLSVGDLGSLGTLRLEQHLLDQVLVGIWFAAGIVSIASTAFLVTRLRASVEDLLRTNDKLVAESAERARATQHLVEAGKAEAIARLAGGLAHDLNNALMVVLGEAELVKDRDPEAGRAIADAVSQASSLTRQILAIGRRSATQAYPHDVGAVLEASARLLARSLPSDVVLSHSVDSGLVVRADPTQLQQVLINLGTNARDAMPHGGTLSMTARRQDERVILEVTDTGVGMDPATQARAFEPFFSTKDPLRGSGLGLASVRAIVTELGGELELDSAPGQGTRVRIALARASEAPQALPATLQASAQASLAARRILVVEDELSIRALIVSGLEAAGADVRHAEDAPAAIEQLRHFDAELVLTDAVMPAGGARPLLEWLAAERPRVPVVLCSGFQDDDAVRREVEEGRVRFLPKPFGRGDAVRACAEALGGAESPRSE